jgi:hypothetical protein
MGLYNSSPGTIVDILYRENECHEVNMPFCILVLLDNYQGELINDQKIFPVFPKK